VWEVTLYFQTRPRHTQKHRISWPFFFFFRPGFSDAVGPFDRMWEVHFYYY